MGVRGARGLEGARYPWGHELTPGGEHRMNVFQGRFPAHDTEVTVTPSVVCAIDRTGRIHDVDIAQLLGHLDGLGGRS